MITPLDSQYDAPVAPVEHFEEHYFDGPYAQSHYADHYGPKVYDPVDYGYDLPVPHPHEPVHEVVHHTTASTTFELPHHAHSVSYHGGSAAMHDIEHEYDELLHNI